MNLTCESCGNVVPKKTYNQKYCSQKCKWHSNRITNQKESRKARRLQLLENFGAACEICGYDTNYAALHFHHKRDKAFPLTAASMTSRPFSELMIEAQKCILLCSNCHMEHHHPQMDKLAIQSSKSDDLDENP
jgi:hypothetical protein